MNTRTLSTSPRTTGKNQEGSALLLGLVIVLMIAGMVAGYLMTTMTRTQNVEGAAASQKALYVAEAGMNQARHKLAQKDASMPVAKNAEATFTATCGDGNYYVTVTRKSDTAVGADPGSNEEFIGNYEVVSTGIVDDARKTLLGVVDLQEQTGGDEVELDGVLFTQENLDLGNEAASKTFTVAGSGPIVHSNADLFVKENVSTSGELRASDDLEIISGFTVSVNGTPQNEAAYEGAQSNEAEVALPMVNAADFESVAQFKLIDEGANEGKIYVVSSGTYEAPEPFGWRYGYTEIIETSTSTPSTTYDNTSVTGSAFRGGILCGKALELSGNFSGNGVSAHTNANATLQGSANLGSGDFDCVGTMTINGNPTAGGGTAGAAYATAHSGRTAISIPEYTAANFLSHAQYRLKADGTITRLSDNTTVTLSAFQWFSNTSTWKMKSVLAGTFFCEANFDIAPSGGGTFQLTVLCEKNISLGAQVAISPHKNDLLLLANQDIHLTANSTLTGIIYAGEEVYLGGTSTLNGVVVARGGTTLGTGDTVNNMGGNFIINPRPGYKMPTNSAQGAAITTTTTVTTTSSVYHPTGWELFDADAADEGFFYGDTDALVSASVGSGSDPFRMTLCLTGTLRVTGQVVMEAYEEDLTLMANQDIQITGSSALAIEGLVLSGEQLSFSDGGSFEGIMVAAGQAAAGATVSANAVTGNHTFTKSSDDLNLPDTDGNAELNSGMAQKRDVTGGSEEDANLGNFGL